MTSNQGCFAGFRKSKMVNSRRYRMRSHGFLVSFGFMRATFSMQRTENEMSIR